jgi:saposin
LFKIGFYIYAVLFITTGTWAYSRDCAKGPEYWCRDAATAKACGAVRHCEQTVWRAKENKIPSMTISETNEMLCNVLVQASMKLFADGSVDVNSIKQYLRHDCTKLPNQNNLIQQVKKKRFNYSISMLFY